MQRGRPGDRGSRFTLRSPGLGEGHGLSPHSEDPLAGTQFRCGGSGAGGGAAAAGGGGGAASRRPGRGPGKLVACGLGDVTSCSPAPDLPADSRPGNGSLRKGQEAEPELMTGRDTGVRMGNEPPRTFLHLKTHVFLVTSVTEKLQKHPRSCSQTYHCTFVKGTLHMHSEEDQKELVW